MIYLASPYTHADPLIEQQRYDAAYAYTLQQIRLGVVIFSPIVYCHHFYTGGHLGGDFSTWKDFNLEMILRSTALRVLRLKGWENSVGVNAEIDYARRAMIPVEYTGL